MNFGLPKCRPGDIAMLKHNASSRNEPGRLLARAGMVFAVKGFDLAGSIETRGWCWHIEPHRSVDGLSLIVSAADRLLTPLRPGDGEDETLRIAGRPVERDATLRPKRQVENAR